MANLSSKTGFTPVQTQIALTVSTTVTSTTSVQDFAAYNAQELTGFIEVLGSTKYRTAVKVMVVKNGADAYEVASVDIAGDNYSSAPLVSFSMSGTTLRATLPAITGATSAKIQYQLNAPALGGQFPLTVDGSNVTAASATAQGTVTTGTQTFAGAKTFTDGTRSIVIGNDVNEPYFGTITNNSLRILSNNIERMRVHANGNVSIGTVTSGSKLNIGGGPVDVGYSPGAGNTTYYRMEHGGSTIVYHNISSNTNYDIVNFGNGVRLAVNGNSWGAISDERKKKNIKSLEYGLTEIEALRPVRFDYKTEETNDSARVGFIAQELAPVIKEAVQGSEDTEYSVTSSDLIPVLVKAIQELSAKVDAQAEEIKRLGGK